MKKIFKIFILMSFVFVNMQVGYSLTICAKNNTYIGLLEKGPNGTVVDADAENKIWKLSFDYDGTTKVIMGVSACNEVCNDVTCEKAKAITNLYTGASDEGNYCWCKMEPVLKYEQETGLTSYWVFYGDMGDATTCANDCTATCANAIATDSSFRAGVYESIW